MDDPMSLRLDDRSRFLRPSRLLLAIGVLPLLLAACGGDESVTLADHTVYAASNAATGNQIIAFRRADDGTLTRLGSYATGGNGSGTATVSTATPQGGIDPLAAQGSIQFSPDKHTLVAVNDGSNSISSFHVNDDGSLTLVSTVSAGGLEPNALAVSNSLVYVTNVGASSNSFASNVSGFSLGADSKLAALPSSTRSLSTATAQPSGAAFDASGSHLVVSELTSGNISVYPVQADGTLGTAVVSAAVGKGPFSVTFAKTGQVIVPEAASGSVSSYTLASNGTLTPISGAVANGQGASCWSIVTPDGRFLYIDNDATGNISSYSIGADGSLTLLNAIASPLEGAKSGSVDMGISEDGRFLYVLDGGLGEVTVLAIQSDGSLTKVQTVSDPGLPMLGAEGLLAR